MTILQTLPICSHYVLNCEYPWVSKSVFMMTLTYFTLQPNFLYKLRSIQLWITTLEYSSRIIQLQGSTRDSKSSKTLVCLLLFSQRIFCVVYPYMPTLCPLYLPHPPFIFCEDEKGTRKTYLHMDYNYLHNSKGREDKRRLHLFLIFTNAFSPYLN